MVLFFGCLRPAPSAEDEGGVESRKPLWACDTPSDAATALRSIGLYRLANTVLSSRLSGQVLARLIDNIPAQRFLGDPEDDADRLRQHRQQLQQEQIALIASQRQTIGEPPDNQDVPPSVHDYRLVESSQQSQHTATMTSGNVNGTSSVVEVDNDDIIDIIPSARSCVENHSCQTSAHLHELPSWTDNQKAVRQSSKGLDMGLPSARADDIRLSSMINVSVKPARAWQPAVDAPSNHEAGASNPKMPNTIAKSAGGGQNHPAMSLGSLASSLEACGRHSIHNTADQNVPAQRNVDMRDQINHLVVGTRHFPGTNDVSPLDHAGLQGYGIASAELGVPQSISVAVASQPSSPQIRSTQGTPAARCNMNCSTSYHTAQWQGGQNQISKQSDLPLDNATQSGKHLQQANLPQSPQSSAAANMLFGMYDAQTLIPVSNTFDQNMTAGYSRQPENAKPPTVVATACTPQSGPAKFHQAHQLNGTTTPPAVSYRNQPLVKVTAPHASGDKATVDTHISDWSNGSLPLNGGEENRKSPFEVARRRFSNLALPANLHPSTSLQQGAARRPDASFSSLMPSSHIRPPPSSPEHRYRPFQVQSLAKPNARNLPDVSIVPIAGDGHGSLRDAAASYAVESLRSFDDIQVHTRLADVSLEPRSSYLINPLHQGASSFSTSVSMHAPPVCHNQI